MKPLAAVARTVEAKAARTRSETAIPCSPSVRWVRPYDVERGEVWNSPPAEREEPPMSNPEPTPQVVVRGEAMLFVDPEIAELWVTATGRARDRQSALERCRARQDEVTAVVTAAGDAVETVETTGLSVRREVVGRRWDGDPAASVTSRLTVGRLDAVGELVVALGRLD